MSDLFEGLTDLREPTFEFQPKCLPVTTITGTMGSTAAMFSGYKRRPAVDHEMVY